MKVIASVFLLLTSFFAVPVMAAEPVDVTLVQLIANPEKFDGKLIRVIGFLRLEFEGNVLYLHREDYEHAILGDGIWVDVTPEMTKQKESLNMHYVLLEGIFSSGDRGHMGMWSGTIMKIRRAELWKNRIGQITGHLESLIGACPMPGQSGTLTETTRRDMVVPGSCRQRSHYRYAERN